MSRPNYIAKQYPSVVYWGPKDLRVAEEGLHQEQLERMSICVEAWLSGTPGRGCDQSLLQSLRCLCG